MGQDIESVSVTRYGKMLADMERISRDQEKLMAEISAVRDSMLVICHNVMSIIEELRSLS